MLNLYASPRGRIGRSAWWLGMVGIIAFSIGSAFLAMALLSPGGDVVAINAASFFLTLVTGGMMYCLHAKRFQDRGVAALPRVAPFLAAWLLDGALMALGVTSGPAGREEVAGAMTAVMFGFLVWYVVELGCLRGTDGPNAYGEDPALLRDFPHMPRDAAGWRPPEGGTAR
ncbi:DUF805 domain-containing protein [Neoroseomonas rubea]|uniref:DUF805 domain-containing protein n=1 Tax=Neoroseomonas rubea TaxID=2748666 RepID=UPI0018DEF472|nr:DUF805 domain-containing protein [Roseomonas rubea]